MPQSYEQDAASLRRARDDLKQQIASQLAAVADLDSRLNGLAPISQLPSEILSRIFLSHARDMAEHHDERVYQWLSVLVVCRRWRNVALNSPGLWTCVFVGPPYSAGLGRARVFLERAKNAPLELVLWLDKKDLTHLLHLLRSSLPRLRTLELRIPDGLLLQSLPGDSFPSSAPLLESLVVQRPTVHNAGSAILPMFLSECATPSLKQLRIGEHNLKWKKGIFPPSLTELYVTCHRNSHPQYSMTDIVDALKGAPALERIELVGVLPPAFPDVTSLSAVKLHAMLPSLNRLCIKSAPATAAYFLAHLRVPASSNVSFQFEGISDDDIQLLGSSLAIQLASPVVNGAEYAVTALELGFESIAFYKNTHVPEPNPRPQFYIELVSPDDEIDEYFTLCYLCRDALRDVTTLTVGDAVFQLQTDSTFVRLLSSLPNLESLSIHAPDPESCAVFVLEIATILNLRHGTPGQCWMPKLKRLALERMFFNVLDDNDDEDGHDGHAEDEGDGDDADAEAGEVLGGFEGDEDSLEGQRPYLRVEDLYTALRTRRIEGCALEELTIRRCLNIDNRGIVILRREVPVVWDNEDYFTTPL